VEATIDPETKGLPMTPGPSTADFAEWVRPHLPALGRYAARLVGPADRDDLVQESLERAWRKWGTYDESRGSAPAWLLAILHDRARRFRTRRRTTLELVDSPEVDSYVDVDLERAVSGLPTRQRQAVELHYFVGLDVATTAQVMGCAEGTVKATLHQARTRLRTQLGDTDD
jgi:RNA polymerase sigma-70 factor (ECF subfamily)